MFGFWDWVGGRYSMDSAIGLSTMLAHRPGRASRDLLAGFHAMDEHFRDDAARAQPARADGPARGLVLGLLRRPEPSACMPYSQYLKRFPAYLQQLTMESNGKQRHARRAARRLRDRRRLLGRARHERPAQLLPAHPPGDAADPGRPHRLRDSRSNPLGDHHDLLMSNVFAQAEALAFGKTEDEVRAEGTAEALVPHRVFEGNRPTNVILAERLTPRALGSLVALYEHSVFTQGDDLGASTPSTSGASSSARRWRSASSRSSRAPTEPELDHDSSTNALIRRYRSLR